MEYHHLRHFLAIADTGSITKAAQELDIAQPALSQSISRMEKSLDLRLFKRTRRGAELTPAGLAIVEDVRLALRKIDMTEQKAKDIASGKAGRLTIGLVSSSVIKILPEALRNMQAIAPKVTLVLQEMNNSEQLEALEKGTIDLGLLHTPVTLPGRMHERLILKQNLVAAVPTSFVTRHHDTISLAEIARLGLVMYPSKQLPVFHMQIISAFQQAGLHIEVNQEASEKLTILSCVAAGLGIGLLPGWITALKFDGVRYLRIEDNTLLPTFNVSAIWPARSMPSLADTFIHAISS